MVYYTITGMNLGTLYFPNVRFAGMCSWFQSCVFLGDAFNTLGSVQDHDADLQDEQDGDPTVSRFWFGGVLWGFLWLFWCCLFVFFKYKFFVCEAEPGSVTGSRPVGLGSLQKWHSEQIQTRHMSSFNLQIIFTVNYIVVQCPKRQK